MKLGKMEKFFINSERHTKTVIKRARGLLEHIDIKANQDLLEIGCGSGPVSKYISGKYGITDLESLNSFIESNNYSTLFSKLSKSLMWNNIEAVYRK